LRIVSLIRLNQLNGIIILSKVVWETGLVSLWLEALARLANVKLWNGHTNAQQTKGLMVAG
jgi:hypothetical protein